MNALPAPTTPLHRAIRGQRGFSLIELLVGILIAMFGVVIMMEVLINSEQRTRTTSGGNEATSSGAIMLQMIQRELAQAGYGLNSTKLLGCTITPPSAPTAQLPIAPAVINPPVALVPAGDANTDRLLIMYGSGAGQPEGNDVSGIVGSNYSMQAPASFAIGDYVLLGGSASPCTGAVPMARVTAKPDDYKRTLSTTVAADTLYNLGPTPHIVAYAVRNGALSTCDYMAVDCRVVNATTWTAVAGGIVNLRAQYGRDTNSPRDGVIDIWDQALATPATSCDIAKVTALRFALVARSSQYETALNAAGQRVGNTVTAIAPTWMGTTAVGATAATPANVALPVNLGAAADWQSYRYRTFETVAPLRNVVWMGQQGC
jgi:type IV pilus assembly protein PilW